MGAARRVESNVEDCGVVRVRGIEDVTRYAARNETQAPIFLRPM